MWRNDNCDVVIIAALGGCSLVVHLIFMYHPSTQTPKSARIAGRVFRDSYHIYRIWRRQKSGSRAISPRACVNVFTHTAYNKRVLWILFVCVAEKMLICSNKNKCRDGEMTPNFASLSMVMIILPLQSRHQISRTPKWTLRWSDIWALWWTPRPRSAFLTAPIYSDIVTYIYILSVYCISSLQIDYCNSRNLPQRIIGTSCRCNSGIHIINWLSCFSWLQQPTEKWQIWETERIMTSRLSVPCCHQEKTSQHGPHLVTRKTMVGPPPNKFSVADHLVTTADILTSPFCALRSARRMVSETGAGVIGWILGHNDHQLFLPGTQPRFFKRDEKDLVSLNSQLHHCSFPDKATINLNRHGRGITHINWR